MRYRKLITIDEARIRKVTRFLYDSSRVVAVPRRQIVLSLTTLGL